MKKGKTYPRIRQCFYYVNLLEKQEQIWHNNIVYYFEWYIYYH